MQFTRLRLQGFKSFVDPTELLIQPGLTGVVGPNGCGKSNLVEALRWVMGETRARAMRGEGMDDVIFAGTQTRGARGQASVDLVIDNRDRLAPAAFNQSDGLEISRRITRDIGSAYSVNGKSVRARDVAMLFADAATGAQSPALVRQGQIAELIAAKPAQRRRVLEDAAGIGGLYQRRHEAELKLVAAEQNIARVVDVLDALAGQLQALERQAAQARRYRAIAADLRRAEAAVLVWRWQAAEGLAAEAAAGLAEAVRGVARAEVAVAEAARGQAAAEAGLPGLRDEAAIAGVVHQRLSLEQARLAEELARAEADIAALAAQAEQLDRDREREAVLAQDAGGQLARLAAESARLVAAQAGEAEAQARAEAAAAKAGEALAARESALDRQTEEAARQGARAAAAQRRRDEQAAAVQRLTRDLAQAESAAAALVQAMGLGAEALTRARGAEEAARAALQGAEVGLEAAEAARQAAQAAEAESRARAASASADCAGLTTEASALQRLLARGAGAGSEVIDQITVAPGYEAALGAALGDDLRLPLLGPTDAGSGWVVAGGDDAPLPAGVESLAARVSGPVALARRLASIGVCEDGDGVQAALAPGQRLVSRAGDLWRWDGLRRRAAQTPSAAAERLVQANRLKGLTAQLAAATRARDQAVAAQEAARATLAAATTAEVNARARRRLAEQALADAARTAARAEAEAELQAGRLAAMQGGIAARRTELGTARAAEAEAAQALADCGDVGAARAEVARLRGEVEIARGAMLQARARLDETRRELRGRAGRLAENGRETRTWQDRADQAGTRLAAMDDRVAALAAARATAVGRPRDLGARRETIAADLARATARRQAADLALAGAEAALAQAGQAERAAERAAGAAREARARAEAQAEAAAAQAEAAEARIAETLEQPAAQVLADLGPLTGSAESAEIEAARLRRQRDALGAVNLRADEDAAEVTAERDALALEQVDLAAAIAKLRQAIADLNREGRGRLMAAFDQVNAKFATLFTHLFGGGEARLVLVASDDPLEAGLEILAQPPGKKLSTLSLLSGGEQTLTALSLIFAVFLSNPAPICVLDEVDAPLDDANVTRFCDLLDEMCRQTRTRFLVITHHAVTMSRMDRLYGVTMVEQGVSQLVSVDLSEAIAAVG